MKESKKLKAIVRHKLADFTLQKKELGYFSPEFNFGAQFDKLIEEITNLCANIPYSENKDFFTEIENDLNSTLDQLLLGNIDFVEYLLPKNIGLLRHHFFPHILNKKNVKAPERFDDFKQLEYVLRFMHYYYIHNRIPERVNGDHLEAFVELRDQILKMNRDNLDGKIEALEFFAEFFESKRIIALTQSFSEHCKKELFSYSALVELSSTLELLGVDPDNKEDMSKIEANLKKMQLFFGEIARLKECQEAIKTISIPSQKLEKQEQAIQGLVQEEEEEQKKKKLQSKKPPTQKPQPKNLPTKKEQTRAPSKTKEVVVPVRLEKEDPDLTKWTVVERKPKKPEPVKGLEVLPEITTPASKEPAPQGSSVQNLTPPELPATPSSSPQPKEPPVNLEKTVPQKVVYVPVPFPVLVPVFLPTTSDGKLTLNQKLLAGQYNWLTYDSTKSQDGCTKISFTIANKTMFTKINGTTHTVFADQNGLPFISMRNGDVKRIMINPYNPQQGFAIQDSSREIAAVGRGRG